MLQSQTHAVTLRQPEVPSSITQKTERIENAVGPVLSLIGSHNPLCLGEKLIR